MKNKITMHDIGIRAEQESLIYKTMNLEDGVFIIAGNGYAQYKIKQAVKVIIDDCMGESVKLDLVQGRDDEEYQSSFLQSMRNDPDIIVFDEVKSENAVKALTHSSRSGNKSIATISSSCAFSAITRLESLGLDIKELGEPDFISGVLYLLPVDRLTPETSISFFEYQQSQDAEQKVIDRINEIFSPEETELMRFRKPDGNNQSSESYFIAEYLKFTPELREKLAKDKIEEAYELHKKTSYVSIDTDGSMIYSGQESINISAIEAVKNGFCDIRDINAKLPIFGDL